MKQWPDRILDANVCQERVCCVCRCPYSEFLYAPVRKEQEEMGSENEQSGMQQNGVNRDNDEPSEQNYSECGMMKSCTQGFLYSETEMMLLLLYFFQLHVAVVVKSVQENDNHKNMNRQNIVEGD